VLVCAMFPLASTAGAQDFSVSTQPGLYPGFDPAITDYVVRCSDAPVEVTVSALPGTQVDVDGQGARAGDFTTEVLLNPGEAFKVVATSSTSSTHHVRCLPPDFPSWTYQRSGQPQAEWYMTSPSGLLQPPAPPGISLRYVAIFDTHGVPVWWSSVGSAGDFKLFSNGNLGWIPSGGPGLEERRLDGTLVRVVQPVSAGLDGHEFLRLPNGNYLVATARTGPAVSLCGQSNVPVLDNGAQEIAPDGSLVWEWWASEHISTTEVPPEWCGAVFNFGNDAYHINSVEPDGDGVVMSFRHLDAVYRVRKSDGSVAWKLGGTARPESLGVLDDPLSTGPDVFRGQHDARMLGDGTLTVHDNGFHANSSRGPRAVRYALDTSARTATLVEQKHDPGPPLTALCCGMSRKLPGDNWVMAWGSSGLITELSTSGERVTSLQFDNQIFSYRAHPVLPGALSRIALRDGMDVQHPRPTTPDEETNGPPASPPPPVSGGAGKSDPTSSITPNVFRLAAKKVQRVLTQKGLLVDVGCPVAACTARVSGSFSDSSTGQTFKLSTARAEVRKGATAKLRLHLSKRASRALRRALKRRKAVIAKITIIVRDASGNTTQKRRTVKLTR
jgi:hypothetical protein